MFDRAIPLLLRFLVALLLSLCCLRVRRRALRTRCSLAFLRRLCPMDRIRIVVRLRCDRTVTPYRQFLLGD